MPASPLPCRPITRSHHILGICSRPISKIPWQEQTSRSVISASPNTGWSEARLCWRSKVIQKKNLPQSHAHLYWRQSAFRLRKSVFLWNEKPKRAELKSAERGCKKRRTSASPAPKQNSLRRANRESFIRGLHPCHRHLSAPCQELKVQSCQVRSKVPAALSVHALRRDR